MDPIDVPNYSSVLSDYKVRIYIFDSQFPERLVLRNINQIDVIYIPTKRLLCGVEDLFNISRVLEQEREYYRIKVSPPGGSCDFIPGANHNEILTLNAKKIR